ncbi:hypothetical protein [Halotia branconii]|uniref:Uncharacterized protein n=1 Tax=Halotia branconii CENA392 TaxID=1539056 RepID=A0AAJ6NWG1_9CYAN|nr:hypothetical protein [Halotia branconii]WGV28009.1 hypothetical protein QI031_11230 [Halotia branconii CENA392]
MAVEVNFCLYLVDNDLIELNEQEIESSFDKYSSYLRDTQSIDGAILIKSHDKKDVIIQDELWVIAQNFCFSSILDLLQKQKECFVYHYFSSYGQIVLISLTDCIRVMGDAIPIESFTTSELLPALYRCGERILNLLHKLQEAGCVDIYTESLEALAKEALQVLQANDMLS